jgi:hypothetical protein
MDLTIKVAFQFVLHFSCKLSLKFIFLVSKKNLKFLQDVEDQAVINIDAINPRLYDHVGEMGDIRVSLACHVYVPSLYKSVGTYSSRQPSMNFQSMPAHN